MVSRVGFHTRPRFPNFCEQDIKTVKKLQNMNITFGILNLACGILFVLISIPLAAKKIPMNKYYGFCLSKSFVSDENWYEINWYGGKQLIQWSGLLILIGILYFIFPVQGFQYETMNVLLALAPIIICPTVAIVKTIFFSSQL